MLKLMPSPRGYKSGKKKIVYGRANKERRLRTITAYRPVLKAASQEIAANLATVFEIEPEMGVMPEVLEIPGRHRVPILDPMLVGSKQAKGFEAGFNLRDAIAEVKIDCDRVQEDQDRDDRLLTTIPISEIVIIGAGVKRNIIAASIEDDLIRRQRKAAITSLGESGMRGFRGKGSKDTQGVYVPVARTKLHIPDDSQLEKIIDQGLVPSEELPMTQDQVIGAVEKSFATSGITVLSVGRLEARTVKRY